MRHVARGVMLQNIGGSQKERDCEEEKEGGEWIILK
jgi:hypothetical protein